MPLQTYHLIPGGSFFHEIIQLVICYNGTQFTDTHKKLMTEPMVQS